MSNAQATSSLTFGANDDFNQFRAGFPVLKKKIHTSINDKMILHDTVRAAINVHLDHLENASATRVEHEEFVTDSKRKFGQLMNAPESTIAAVRNVSDGVNTIAWAMPFKEGDNVIVGTDAEHPNNIYPWLRQQERGVEVRGIASRADGAIDADAMLAAIDGRTRVMAVASVTFAPGHRADLARLGAECRKRDVFLLVDGVQSAGIMHHDFDAEPIDAFTTSTSKGLLGLYGYGFLYVSPKWLDRLNPAYLSRPAVKMSADDHSTMGRFDYEWQPDSRRFEVGSFNLAGAYAADAALGLLLGLGSKRIERRVLDLSTQLNEGLAALGLHVAVPSSGPEQSHVVTVGEVNAGGHGFSTDPKIEPISKHLIENKVAHTIRRGQLRFGLHAYNNEDDVAAVIRHASDALARL